MGREDMEHVIMDTQGEVKVVALESKEYKDFWLQEKKQKDCGPGAVAKTTIKVEGKTDIDIRVSTVLLPFDHSWGAGEPQYFETMVFDADDFSYEERSSTIGEAFGIHEVAVDKVVAWLSKNAPLTVLVEREFTFTRTPVPDREYIRGDQEV
jgi:hypothetical protein